MVPKFNIKEGFLTGILKLLVANELDKRLDSIVSQIDTDKAEKSAERIRKGLIDLEKSRRMLCQSRPDHPLCKRGADGVYAKWK